MYELLTLHWMMFSRLIGNMGGQLFRCKCLLKDVLKGVRSLLCLDVCLPYCGVVEFKRPEFWCWRRTINESIAPVFSCSKTKEFRSAVWKTVATAVTCSPPATQDGPCTLNRLSILFWRFPRWTFLFTDFFVCFLRKKMFTLPSFKKNLKDKKK